MMSTHLKKHPEIILPPTATLRTAMEIITNSQVGIVLVTEQDRRLLGIVVDSDIRRALLRGKGMEVPISEVMNATPFIADAAASSTELAVIFRAQRMAYLPIVDKEHKLVGLAGMVDYMTIPESCPNWVVIMAGGQGMRLRPLTEKTPKPMMRIGNKPLLELVIERLVASGLNRFILSVNYLGDQIKDHFGDGSRWAAQIEYVTEDTKMGTAGALGLITRDLERSFIVMNGDLLTKVNFRSLLDFHQGDGNLATLCVREYDFQVPYGVVKMQDNKLASIDEKPVHRFFVNAGIYVLEPSVLSQLKAKTSRDMPDLLDGINRSSPGKVGCFPIQEYWLDIGKVEDYQRAVQEFGQQFP